MRIRVLKFGGTSLFSPERRQLAVALVRDALSEGVAPVIVVSAIGRRGEPYATDSLLDLLHGTNPKMPPREVALLASCGEIIAAVVMAGALLSEGIGARALTGQQAGIRTTNGYTGASICEVDPDSLLGHLRADRVPVVAGFQGSASDGEMAVLDRGGSDVTASALGWALGAERIDIFKDVPGIMTADPFLVPDARSIDELTCDQAVLMARHGAKVLHPEAIEWARRGPVLLCVRSLFDASQCTRITANTSTLRPPSAPVGLACMEGGGPNSIVISVVGTKMGDSSTEEVIGTALRRVKVPHHLVASLQGVISVTVPIADMGIAAAALHAQLFSRLHSSGPSL